MMNSKNTAFINKNSLRRAKLQLAPGHRPTPGNLFQHATEMQDSEDVLHQLRDAMQAKAYNGLVHKLAKRYHINADEAFNMMLQVANFSKPYGAILMKMLQGEPVHLASEDQADHPDDSDN